MTISAELGDHCPLVHTAAVVSEFRFVPVQTEIMEVNKSLLIFLSIILIICPRSEQDPNDRF